MLKWSLHYGFMEVVYPESWMKKVEEGPSSSLQSPRPPHFNFCNISKTEWKNKDRRRNNMFRSNRIKDLEDKICRLQKAIVFIIECTDFDLTVLEREGFDLSEFSLPGVLDPPDSSIWKATIPISQTPKKSTGLSQNPRWEAKQLIQADENPNTFDNYPPIFPMIDPKPEPCDEDSDGDPELELYGESALDSTYSDSLCEEPASSSRAGGHIRLLGHVVGPIYSCSECPDLVFDDEEDYDKHSLKVHGIKKKKIYTCEYCGKVDRWKGKHFNHVRTHTGEKPFKCNLCGHAAKTSQYLKEHLKIHSDEKPFGCDQCGQRFRRRPEVKMHKKKAHNIENDLIRACPICKAEFKDNGKLNRHIQDIHENKRTLKCHLCNQPFKRKEHLEKHLQRHNNPKRRKRGPQKPNPRNKPKADGERQQLDRAVNAKGGKLIENNDKTNNRISVAPPILALDCKTVLSPHSISASRSRTTIEKRTASTAKRMDQSTESTSSSFPALTQEQQNTIEVITGDLKEQISEDDDSASTPSGLAALCETVYGEPSINRIGQYDKHSINQNNLETTYAASVGSEEVNSITTTTPDDVKDFQIELLD